jgi:hypothetical protein
MGYTDTDKIKRIIKSNPQLNIEEILAELDSGL